MSSFEFPSPESPYDGGRQSLPPCRGGACARCASRRALMRSERRVSLGSALLPRVRLSADALSAVLEPRGVPLSSTALCEASRFQVDEHTVRVLRGLCVCLPVEGPPRRRRAGAGGQQH